METKPEFLEFCLYKTQPHCVGLVKNCGEKLIPGLPFYTSIYSQFKVNLIESVIFETMIWLIDLLFCVCCLNKYY
jgi:hypothetical protein